MILGLHHWYRASANVKRQPTNTLDKPVLDQVTFQQLLAAAYTLQEQNARLLEAKADFPQTLSDRAIAEKVPLNPLVSLPFKRLAETGQPQAQTDVEPLASLNDSVLQPEIDARVPVLAREVQEDATFKRPQSKSAQLVLLVQHSVPCATSGSRDRMVRRRASQGNELFWRAATAVAMAAVSALLLGASIHRLSPLPAGLALPSEKVQQQVPFRRTKRIVTVPAQRGGVGTKTIVMEPQARKSGSTERTVVADKPPESRATPASPRKTIVNPTRVHSAYESEADMVAPDTVVRYCIRSAAPRLQVQKQP